MLPFPPAIKKPQKFSCDEEFQNFIIHQNSLLLEQVSKNESFISTLRQILATVTTSDSDDNNIKLLLSPAPSSESIIIYQAKLKLTSELPEIFCKSKYIRFSLMIESSPGFEIYETDSLVLSLELYSIENPPRQILHTMQGRDIFRGQTKAKMMFDIVELRHLAHFKFQINEVSSHYCGGVVNLVIQADRSLESRGILIEPFVIRNLKVRAKFS